jgi:hypothetical protein
LRREVVHQSTIDAATRPPSIDGSAIGQAPDFEGAEMRWGSRLFAHVDGDSRRRADRG